ncbi:MAG: hypothetical protein FJ126_09070 [Deltaproteobacteria bacterium]|nr:hypothetical protein [Deltaproteobacteria bacterium]
MKKIGLLVIILTALGGCVSVDHSTVIGTDASGLATGQYRDSRTGNVCNVDLYGAGAGAAVASSAASMAQGALGLLSIGNATALGARASRGATSSESSSGAGGMFGIRITEPRTQGNPLPFAQSIATINYSRKLKSVKYDEFGGIYEYEFGDPPRTAAVPKASPPPNFGYQPMK